MSVIDIFLVASIFFVALVSYRIGVIEQLGGFLVWATAIWSGIYYSPDIAELFRDYIEIDWIRYFTGGAILFVLVLAVGTWLLRSVATFAAVLGLSWLNHIFGFMFGVLFGCVLSWVLLYTSTLLPLKVKLDQQDWWHDSKIIPYILDRGDKVIELMRSPKDGESTKDTSEVENSQQDGSDTTEATQDSENTQQ